MAKNNQNTSTGANGKAIKNAAQAQNAKTATTQPAATQPAEGKEDNATDAKAGTVIVNNTEQSAEEFNRNPTNAETETAEAENTFAATDDETHALNEAANKDQETPKEGEIKNAGDATTITNPETGETVKSFSAENPNEVFTESPAAKIQAATDAENDAEIYLDDESDLAIVKELDEVITEVMSFAGPVSGALSDKPLTHHKWNDLIARARKAQQKFKALLKEVNEENAA